MAELTVADILAKVGKRKSRHVGIGIASDYVSTIGACFGTEGAERFFGMGSDRQWAQALKESQGKLVYRQEDMKVTGVKSKLLIAKQRKYPTRKPSRKEDDAAPTVTAGACMEFDCVLTSKKRDRDRDILEPSGARVDPSMPLLWQHIPMQPIGKLVKVITQDEEQVVVRCAIADNAFGRDVAQLVEFGALRISHGFVPTKFEPIEEDENADPWMQGWHVLEYDVLEVSTVSIPSNTDAVITGFSRGKLHHPLVKSWAQAVSRERPTMVPVGDVKMTQPINVHVHLGDDAAAKLKAKKDDDETPKEGEEETEEKMEVSELASLGRVHLMIEQAMKVDGLPEEASDLLGQALGELEAAMNGEEEEGEETEEETNEEETEEEKEGEDDEDGKEPHQYVMEDEDTEEEKEGEDEDDDEDEEKGEVTPDDSEGRADEDEEKGYDVASDLFASALAKHRNGTKTAPKKGKTPPAKTGGKAKK